MLPCRPIEKEAQGRRLMGDINNLNPLSPNSEENEIYLYIFTTCSNIQVIRLKEMIPKDTELF